MIKLYQFCRTGVVCLALLLTSCLLFSQSKRTLTAYPNTVVDTYVHGFYASLPANYSTSGKKYPLLIFLHGMGEIGDGSAASLATVLRNGPPMQINQQVNNNVNANFPDPVVVNGKSYEFIVIAPQLNGWPVIGPAEVAINNVINYAIAHYRVDTAKMYLTGLSMGGGITWEYAGLSGPLYAKRLAGLLPVAGASYPVKERAAEIAKEHLPVWATANSSDPQVPTSYTTGYIDLLNKAGANPAPLMTIFPEQNQHGGWLKTYGAPNQPGVVQNGLNVYQWMLQYKRQGDNVVIDNAPAVPTLTVNAGADQSVTLPNRSTLKGAATATNSTITGYKWTQVSGPGVAYFLNSGAAQTQAVGLVAGTYVFRLTATGSTGLTASDQITVKAVAGAAPTLAVNAGADQTITLPARSTLKGAATATNSTITAYKWTQVSGPAIAYFLNSNAAQTQAVGLVAGTYVFRLTATGSTGLTSSDQITVAAKTATTAAVVSTGKTSALSLGDSADDAGRTVKLYPNPVSPGQQFAVEGQGWKAGTLKFLIYDISGKMVKQVVLENQSSYFRQTIPATGLAKGSYVLAIVTEGEKPRTFKLLIE